MGGRLVFSVSLRPYVFLFEEIAKTPSRKESDSSQLVDCNDFARFSLIPAGSLAAAQFFGSGFAYAQTNGNFMIWLSSIMPCYVCLSPLMNATPDRVVGVVNRLEKEKSI